MNRPRICAVIVNEDIPAIEVVSPLVDMYEVRIDLIGAGWPGIIGKLKKPWIACNRIADEGGNWKDSEAKRLDELFRAAELGADIVDIEIMTKNLAEVIQIIKGRAKCLLSYHDLASTPSLDSMKEIVEKQLTAGADICKVITTASRFNDNLMVLRLISEFPRKEMVAFAMGPSGAISRVLCPLAGGYLTYASVGEGKESATGQITARELRKTYDMLAEDG